MKKNLKSLQLNKKSISSFLFMEANLKQHGAIAN